MLKHGCLDDAIACRLAIYKLFFIYKLILIARIKPEKIYFPGKNIGQIVGKLRSQPLIGHAHRQRLVNHPAGTLLPYNHLVRAFLYIYRIAQVEDHIFYFVGVVNHRFGRTTTILKADQLVRLAYAHLSDIEHPFGTLSQQADTGSRHIVSLQNSSQELMTPDTLVVHHHIIS